MGLPAGSIDAPDNLDAGLFSIRPTSARAGDLTRLNNARVRTLPGTHTLFDGAATQTHQLQSETQAGAHIRDDTTLPSSRLAPPSPPVTSHPLVDGRYLQRWENGETNQIIHERSPADAAAANVVQAVSFSSLTFRHFQRVWFDGEILHLPRRRNRRRSFVASLNPRSFKTSAAQRSDNETLHSLSRRVYVGTVFLTFSRVVGKE